MVHGDDWRAATDAVVAPVLTGYHEQWRKILDVEPGPLLATGSGWGALEARRMPAYLPGTPFPPESLGPEQEPWLSLLDGVPPAGDPLAVPPSTLVNRYWADLLEHTADNWLTWYHRGVARWAAGRHEAAREAWAASVSAAENPWALRCLAVTAGSAEAAQLYERALKLAPALEPLLVEAVAAGCAPELPPEPTGRLALLAAQARLARGDVEGARAIFDAGFEVANIREGETSLSDTWAALSADPLPGRYDFRMK